MKLYIMTAIAITSALAGAFGSWQVQQWRYGAKEADRLEAVARDRMRAEKNIDTAAMGHETDKVRIETEFVTITERITDVVKEPFYVDGACLDAAGLQLVADALGPAAAASQPATAVPRSDATR